MAANGRVLDTRILIGRGPELRMCIRNVCDLSRSSVCKADQSAEPWSSAKFAPCL
jgi:hypothetical protein